MPYKACLKCGHVIDVAATPPEACPLCGADYAHIEAAFVRGEAISRVAPEVILTRQRRLASIANAPPSLLASLLIAAGFSLALLALLGGLAVFGMILSAPDLDANAPWTKANTRFVRSLAIGWGIATVISLGFSMSRRPLAGVLTAMGAGLLAGVAAVFLIP